MHTFILRALRQLHKISSSEDLTGADYGGSLYLNCIVSGRVRRVLEFFRIISYKRYPTTSSLRRHSLCHSETEYCAHQRGSGARVVIPEIYTTNRPSDASRIARRIH